MSTIFAGCYGVGLIDEQRDSQEAGMNTWRLVLIALGVGAWFATAGTTVSWAQSASPPPAPEAKPSDTIDITGEMELTRAAIQVRRQALVTSVMDLEPKQAEAFWPLYRDYRAEMTKVNDRLVKLLTVYLDNFDNLTDETAAKLMAESLSIDRERNKVKSKYVSRFAKVIPPKQVARFYQVENKLDAVINAELARIVPLAR